YRTELHPRERARLPVAPRRFALDRVLQPRHDERVRHVAPGALEHAAERVAGAAEPAGERFRVVDRDEDRVDVVHHREEVPRLLELAAPEAVEHLAAQLTRGLRHAVQVRGGLDAQLLGARDRLAGHERQREVRLGELLLGVVEAAAVADVVVAVYGGVGLGEERGRLRDQLARGEKLAPVDGPDRRRAGSNRAPGRVVRDLAGAVLLLEDGAGAVTGSRKLAGPVGRQLSPPL